MTDQRIEGLRKALALGGDTHSLDDVLKQVQDGDAQLWWEEDAVIVTEIHLTPRKRVLHFWLAAGDLDTVIKLSERAITWGREMGCERATISGRRGWERALKSEGWSAVMTSMSREL